MLAPEDENDAEVRREDQIYINTFARLNARLYELRSDRESLKVRMHAHTNTYTQIIQEYEDRDGAKRVGDLSCCLFFALF